MTSRETPFSTTPFNQRYNSSTNSDGVSGGFRCFPGSSRQSETPYLTKEGTICPSSAGHHPYRNRHCQSSTACSSINPDSSSSFSGPTEQSSVKSLGSSLTSGSKDGYNNLGKGNALKKGSGHLSSTRTPVLYATARRYGSGTNSVIRTTRKDPASAALSSYFTEDGECSSTRTTSISPPKSRDGTPHLEESETIRAGSVQKIQRVERCDSSITSDNQVCLSLLWHAGKLGVAYYDVETSQIHVMLDTMETDNFELVHKVVKQVQPTVIVVSTKQDERLVKALKTYVNGEDKEDVTERGTSQLQFLPSLEFSAEICKRRVLFLDLPCIPDHFTETEKTLYISSLLPFDNICMIRAMGGLLKYLDKMRVGIELEDISVRVPVLGVQITSVENQMILDDTAYSSLQIFQRESHPSVYKVGSSNSTKEGLSLFGIMNRCKSQIGSRLLRLWFMRPLKDVTALQQRLDAITFFTNPKNVEIVRTLEESVRNIKNISKTLTRMICSQASVSDWQGLYKTVYSAAMLREVCRSQPHTIHIFKKIADTFTDDLHVLTQLIHRVMDFEESQIQGRFIVKQHVDEDLDEKKRMYSGLPDFMTKIAAKELEKLREDITECNVLYMPLLGYLLAIPRAAIGFPIGPEDNYSIEGLHFVFYSNNVLHYKSACTRELDQMFGDTRCDITDIEVTLMHKLQSTVLHHSNVLMSVLDCAAQLDCLLSLAACAREYGYVRPELTEETFIDIEAGRHPIQEMCCTTFVPNSCLSNAETGKLKVLTGPNACGKSVYIKQVALIVFLAQIGSFVPAERATIGLVDRIFTRVRSHESVSVGLSTFMIDINQMSSALRSAGEKSLCIIDEFGKGTGMVDGMSLLCACLKYWLSAEIRCPHVLVSTHFHSLIHQHLLPRSPLIKYLTLETLNNGEELVFLYQLTEGHTNSSYAGHVAAQVGLPLEIVKRGAEVSELIRQGQPVQRIDTADTATQLKRCRTVVNRFLELDLETGDVKGFLENVVLSTLEASL